MNAERRRSGGLYKIQFSGKAYKTVGIYKENKGENMFRKFGENCEKEEVLGPTGPYINTNTGTRLLYKKTIWWTNNNNDFRKVKMDGFERQDLTRLKPALAAGSVCLFLFTFQFYRLVVIPKLCQIYLFLSSFLKLF
jgi:hypothetical protein